MRSPRACGALGRFDRRRVRRMAELLGAGAFAHEDGSSALLLDREPLRWEAGGARGLGWTEGDLRRPATAFPDWRAAAEAGICGLLLDGRRRALHSAVNGLAPLYWLEHDGAVYFASRIDPLVQTSPVPLSVDWQAWASILTIRVPCGSRTPFAEIARLPQQALLRRRLGRARVEEKRWPWAETTPPPAPAAAAEGAVAALEELLAPVPEGIVCPLSGGRDSRMLLSVLARDRRVAEAVTVNDDEGDTREEDLAAPVAAAFGVPHQQLREAEAQYPDDWEERARRVDYQLVDHPWLLPLTRHLATSGAPVPDGFAIDVLVSGGPPFHSDQTLDTADPRAATLAMFEMLRHWGHAHVALEEGFQEPVVSSAREQYLAATRHFEGHPLQNVLALYSTRSRRGVSTNPTQLIGDSCHAITPGASSPFARSVLSTPTASRVGAGLYRAIFEILDGRMAALPTTAELARKPPRLPRRWCSPAALEAHRRSLLDGPLTPYLSAELRAWIEGAAAAEPNPHLRLGIESVGLLHSWWRRYRGKLRETDARELLG